MSKKISQDRARRAIRELEELRQKTRADRVWCGGTSLRSFTINSESRAVFEAVKALGHPLAARVDGDTLYIYGVR